MPGVSEDDAPGELVGGPVEVSDVWVAIGLLGGWALGWGVGQLWMWFQRWTGQIK